MATPKIKVHNPKGEYVASLKRWEDAACLIALYGEGATIRYDHAFVLWTEGSEGFEAGESYDRVAAVCVRRLGAAQAYCYERNLARLPLSLKAANAHALATVPTIDPNHADT